MRRLSSLAPLDDAALGALAAAVRNAHPFAARRELIAEGDPILEPRLIANGWGVRVRLLPDGRRQILSFLLPGDLIGYCRHQRPVASSSVIAVHDLSICTAPNPQEFPTLAEAYSVSAAMEETYLLAHITRLGRLSAQERIYDLLLELRQRLTVAGLTRGGAFELPLTQEMLADALGLTPVHINRTLQLARSQGDLQWAGRRVTLTDPEGMAERVGHVPSRVCDAAAAGTARHGTARHGTERLHARRRVGNRISAAPAGHRR